MNRSASGSQTSPISARSPGYSSAIRRQSRDVALARSLNPELQTFEQWLARNHQLIPIDEAELQRLFGEPALLRKTALAFELAQLAGRHTLLATALGALAPLRSHLLGIWRIPR